MTMDFIRAKNILNKVEAFILRHHLLSKNQVVLVGVSGGVDSIVLLHILLSLDYACVVAHMNFGLRDQEADADEAFVKAFCERNGCEFQSKRVETKSYALDKGISIEMAARELRYSWFSDIIKETDAELIAVGHHLNDSIETVFLNLTRITGIRGISGIAPANGNVIRPLLCLKQDEVLEYAKENRLKYRIDCSNEDVIYKRNLVRHQIIPKFYELESSFANNMNRTLSYLRDTKELVDDYTAMWKSNNLIKENGIWRILFRSVCDKSYGRLLLYEALKDFGFKNDQVLLIYDAALKEPGRRFFTDKFVLYVDRDAWQIADLDDSEEHSVFSEVDSIPFNLCVRDKRLELLEVKKDETFILPKKISKVAIAADKLKFPLVIRKWKKGDWFVPFGMKGRKKISDFLIDNKVSLLNKANVYVLISGDDIVWVMGFRLDNRFKVDNDTSNVLIAQFE